MLRTNLDFDGLGCRSQLSIWIPRAHPEFLTSEYRTNSYGVIEYKCIDGKWHDPDEPLFYSRFNLGVCSINLPDVTLSAMTECGIDVTSDEVGSNDYYTNNFRLQEVFNRIFNERLELCHKVLEARYQHLKTVKAEVAPILWQYGALARLKPTDTLHKLLINGHTTISLGYIGLAETVKALSGKSHTQEGGRELGMRIMKKLHDICDEWNEDHYIGYSLYGTPSENYVSKATDSLDRRFPNNTITKKGWITNSYHIPVDEPIDAFTKLTKEAPFQTLSSGGNISYIETPSMVKNLPALMAVVRHIYNTNIYAEINTKLDYCKHCGFSGEVIAVKTENGNFVWKCPQCGTTDGNNLVVVRRICGYLGAVSKGYGTGIPSRSRMNDIVNRVCHL